MFAAALIAALPALAAAAPAAATSPHRPASFAVTVHVPEVKHPNSHGNFEGLNVVGYHTGAGENDVAATALSNLPNGREVAQLNSTHLIFTLGDYPYAMRMYGGLQPQYTGWLTPVLNIGDYPYTGTDSTYQGSFFINSTGIQWSSGTTGKYVDGDLFGGWIMCDWWHGKAYPQLFWLENAGGVPTPSDNCEVVQLKPNYLPAPYSS